MNNTIKVLLTTVCSLVLLWGAPGLAEVTPLTDTQMDSITAGTAGDENNHVFVDVDAYQSADVDNPGAFNSVDALNVAIAPETNANSINVDNSVNFVKLEGDALEHARAVNIVTGVSNKVGSGVNAHAIVDRGLGGQLDSSLSGSRSLSLDTKVPFINQSNIIIQQR